MAAYCREDYDTKQSYIGITSYFTEGAKFDKETATRAMESRRRKYDEEKRRKINFMIDLFETTVYDFCKVVETKLIEHFKFCDHNINDRDGGGGRTPQTANRHLVYLALVRKNT